MKNSSVVYSRIFLVYSSSIGWLGARPGFGPAAELITPGGGRVAAAADIGRELLELTGVEGIDPAHCEGELQLRFEDPYEVTADLVDRSLA